MASVAEPLLTADDFHSTDHRGFELVDGEVREVREVANGTLASWTGREVGTRIGEFATARKLGLVFPQGTGVQLACWGGSTVLKPDGMFVARAKLAGRKLPTGWLDVVPDLAVEVVSPGDRVEELEKKLTDYRRANVPLVWVVYPANRTARIQRADGSVDFIDADGYLDGEDVLPGFRLQLGEVFEAADAITR